MTFPTIHSNGTSKERLLDAIENAYQALNNAFDKLKETAPNGRDYYPQSDTAFYAAADEHRDRMKRIDDVRNELGAIAEEISFK